MFGLRWNILVFPPCCPCNVVGLEWSAWRTANCVSCQTVILLKTGEIYTTIILLGSSFNKLFASVQIGCNRLWQGLQCVTTLKKKKKKKKKKERKSFGVKSKHVWPRFRFRFSTILTRWLIISVEANTGKKPLYLRSYNGVCLSGHCFPTFRGFPEIRQGFFSQLYSVEWTTPARPWFWF